MVTLPCINFMQHYITLSSFIFNKNRKLTYLIHVTTCSQSQARNSLIATTTRPKIQKQNFLAGKIRQTIDLLSCHQ